MTSEGCTSCEMCEKIFRKFSEALRLFLKTSTRAGLWTLRLIQRIFEREFFIILFALKLYTHFASQAYVYTCFLS